MMVDCIGFQGSGGTSEAICLISALLAYCLLTPPVKILGKIFLEEGIRIRR